VETQLDLPAAPFAAPIKLRLRVPEGHEIRSVTMNGRPWTQFDAQQETVTLPAKLSGKVSLTVSYR
jgi:hypothetical protein